VLLFLPDIFCALYDELDGGPFLEHGEAWNASPTVESLALVIERKALEGTLTENEITFRLTNHADRHETALAILRGLDRAFAYVNPVADQSDRCPSALAALGHRVRVEARLDSAIHGGALIPRLVRREPAEFAPDDLREAFGQVLRVEESLWRKGERVLLGDSEIFMRHDLSAGLRMATVPFIEDPDEMRFEVDTQHGREVYRIAPVDAPATIARMETVLDALIAADVHIALLPELCLSPTLLARWQEALRARRGATGSLQWLLAGSGDLGSSPRANTALLLSARTGLELARQDKRYRFNFDETVLKRWGLESRLGSAPLQEDMVPGEMLTIIEGGAIRAAILVCEDLARLIDRGPIVRAFGISHIFVPIFARPINEHRWEQAHSGDLVRDVGASVIVANSLIIRSILGKGTGTGLVACPDETRILESASAEAPAAFTIAPDGSLELDS
jgi:predicted amidohydrolase